MAGTIVINREKGLRCWARKFRIVLNNQQVGDIKNGGCLSVPVDPGRHSVLVEFDTCRSPDVVIEVSDKEVVCLRCGFPRKRASLFRSVVSLNNPELWKEQNIATLTKNSIFMSYRRADTQEVAGRIYDHLANRFGKDAVFKDVDSIGAGEKWVDSLQRSLRECRVALVLIGDSWEHIELAKGKPRILQEDDPVRREVEAVLQRGIQVIPILIRRTKMPDIDYLPESISQLSGRQFRCVRSDPDFRHDIRLLKADLQRIVDTGAEQTCRATG